MAHATSVDEFSVQSAVAEQSIAIRTGGEGGGSVDGDTWHDLGAHGFGVGQTSAQGGPFPQATATLDDCGGGGGFGLCFGGNASANASSTLTYEYIFTAKNPDEVRTFISQSPKLIVTCTSEHVGPCDNGLPYRPDFYVPNATKIEGGFTINTAGYARGSVSADGYTPGGLGQFDLQCGYGAHDLRCGSDGSGSFKIFGVLGANDASIAANSFFGFITLRASSALFEGGYAYAAIDPVITFDLPGVDPNDFTLTLSPGFVNAGPSVSGVPEPTQWALMLAGFGLVGALARHRRALSAA